MTTKNSEPHSNEHDKDELNKENEVNNNNNNELSAEQNTIETLKQQLETLKSKADKNWDLAVRAKAELENVRKRSDQEVNNAHKYALEKFIPELLPLLDGLDQGLHSIPAGEEYNTIREGMMLSIKMFTDTLFKFGVEVIDPMNQAFDPNKHEAISMQPSDQMDNNMVMAVVQKGYELNKRVLRPARVIVVKNQ